MQTTSLEDQQVPQKVIITGASSGIGFETAIDLAVKGHEVIALARSKEKLENLQKITLSLHPDAKIFAIVFGPYLKKGVSLRFEYYLNTHSLPIDFAGVKVLFEKEKKSDNLPSISRVVKYINLDLLNNSEGENILTFKEKIYGDNCT
ncbi:MAG: SDR family NAD(P)-dependent oxidoreductase, partial [Bacteroidetes bacterium]|nr:SDR family NAD(P)-dependent oxidoreductase [Bacteroidota bacterium]